MDDNSLAIDIRDLHFSYPDGTPALEGVDLQVHEGARVALIGPNGAGKSTLMLHLNGLLHGQGFIRVLGMELTEANLATIRRQVGLCSRARMTNCSCPQYSMKWRLPP